MAVQGAGVELRQHVDLVDAAVDAVADWDVDQPEDAAKCHCGLCTPGGQRPQICARASAQDHGCAIHGREKLQHGMQIAQVSWADWHDHAHSQSQCTLVRRLMQTRQGSPTISEDFSKYGLSPAAEDALDVVALSAVLQGQEKKTGQRLPDLAFNCVDSKISNANASCALAGGRLRERSMRTRGRVPSASMSGWPPRLACSYWAGPRTARGPAPHMLLHVQHAG